MAARPRGRPRHPDVLTPTEWAVLDCLRHGMTQRQIAQRRGVSRDAIKYHVDNIAGKLGVRGSQELRHWPGIAATSRLAARRTVSTMHDARKTQLGAIGQISLSIRDVGRAEHFYGETLGLPHIFTFGDLVFFDCHGIRLYLHRKDARDWQPGSILYFTVDGIHAAQDELSSRGVKFSGAPHVVYTDDATGVEEWMTFFDDGEGNTLALMSRVQPGQAPAS